MASSDPRYTVSVVVLGDIGRSPRMQNHALSLADDGAEVELIGYSGSEIPAALEGNARIRCRALAAPLPAAPFRRRGLFAAYSALRSVAQAGQLLATLLFRTRRPAVLLVQTPPAIPTLWIAWIAARLRGSRLVVDWHNFGHTMLALRFGNPHLLVRLATHHEKKIGRRADAHLCVSRAMQRELEKRWGVRAAVAYDRASSPFEPTPLHRRHELFRRLGLGSDLPEASPCASRSDPAIGFREATFATVLSIPSSEMDGEIARNVRQRERGDALDALASLQRFVRLRSDRPALVVSPTSWTADEDFSLLLEAIPLCEAAIRAHDAEEPETPFPTLLVLITGKGPLRQEFERRLTALPRGKVQVRTHWLSPEDYALLLGSADLGLCLHRSSSGVDLPMKIADMIGAGLPVCALDYGPCLAEIIEPGRTAILFSTAEQLASRLYQAFARFPRETPLLDQLRRESAPQRARRWGDEWREVVRPIVAPRA